MDRIAVCSDGEETLICNRFIINYAVGVPDVFSDSVYKEMNRV